MIDPITVEVIGIALSSIVEEMGEALIRASYSTNIKERRDCSTALFDIDGKTLCQAEHIPMHLGSFLDLIPHIMKRHPLAEMRPGDVFCGNDAYEGGGTHLPDIVLAEPVFVDGEMIAWAVNLAHHADFADRGHAHIYQEGLRIPPIRLYRAGVLQQDIQALILLNCQVPRERLSDLRAQMAANRLGVQRLQGMCAKYGRATVLQAGAALQDYAERKMRAGISTVPDGEYSFADRYDCPEVDGELHLSCTITVTGDAMHLRFEAPPQVRAGLNMTMTALLSTVYYAVKSIVDPSILPNAGLARPLTVSAPEGSIVNCAHPAAVNGRLSLCQRVVDLISGALAQAVAAQGDGGIERGVLFHHLRGPSAGRQCALGVSRNDRRRGQVRASQGRAGWGACAYDQHLQPAGGGAGAGVPADLDALRAGGWFRRSRPVSRRDGDPPGLPNRPRLSRPRRRRPFIVRTLGTGRRNARRNGVDHRLGAVKSWCGNAAVRRHDRSRYCRIRRIWFALGPGP